MTDKFLCIFSKINSILDKKSVFSLSSEQLSVIFLLCN